MGACSWALAWELPWVVEAWVDQEGASGVQEAASDDQEARDASEVEHSEANPSVEAPQSPVASERPAEASYSAVEPKMHWRLPEELRL